MSALTTEEAKRELLETVLAELERIRVEVRDIREELRDELEDDQ